jgi:hypothetical protein
MQPQNIIEVVLPINKILEMTVFFYPWPVVLKSNISVSKSNYYIDYWCKLNLLDFSWPFPNILYWAFQWWGHSSLSPSSKTAHFFLETVYVFQILRASLVYLIPVILQSGKKNTDIKLNNNPGFGCKMLKLSWSIIKSSWSWLSVFRLSPLSLSFPQKMRRDSCLVCLNGSY